MAFDLIILLLCAYRLANNRFTNGLAAQLLRDGIVCLVLSPVDEPHLITPQLALFCCRFRSQLHTNDHGLPRS